MELKEWYWQVMDFFSDRKVPVFLHGSTLLGAVRKGILLERIPFDRELNIGIRASDLSEQLLWSMRETFPYFLPTGDIRPNCVTYFGPENINLYLPYGKSHWDMKPAFAMMATFWEGKTKWIEYMGSDICLTWPKYQLFSFSGMNLAGREVNIPHNRHEWLSHYFGNDYMTEKLNWHYSTDSCNRESYKQLVKEGEITL